LDARDPGLTPGVFELLQRSAAAGPSDCGFTRAGLTDTLVARHVRTD
jgi:hypothetical protein